MAIQVAFLRAVNVGGTGALPMAELRAMAERMGLDDVGTVLQSGNLVFRTSRGRAAVRADLESALAARMGRPVGVLLRTPADLAAILERNPFPRAAPDRVIVHLLERPLPPGALAGLRIPGGEEVLPSGREVFVHYPEGIGRSRLRLPFAAAATGRNLNTLRRVLEHCGPV